MKEAEIPEDDANRIRALQRLDILDTPHEEVFDRITRIASEVFGVPISLVSLVDEDRQWFKSRFGLDATETPRNISFCGHAIHGDDPLIVPDASLDVRFDDNPLVTGDLGLRFYAGYPLKIADGARIGTLCLIDQKPRELTAKETDLLSGLAAIAVRELEFRRAALSDPLTGAFNRAMMAKLGNQEYARSKRDREQFCIAKLKLDRFSELMDAGGPAFTDTVLVQFAGVCGDFLRPEDAYFRLAGDEFGILMGSAAVSSAEAVMERLRIVAEAIPLSVDGEPVSVTVSIGIGGFLQDDLGLDNVLERAEAGLKSARDKGGNQVAAG